MEVILIDDVGKMEIDQWYETLDHCPSQCYRHAQRDGVDYILYLRWRWSDPWQAHIVKNAWNKPSMNDQLSEWSGDLFYRQDGLYFTHDEYKEAQRALLQIFQTTSKSPAAIPDTPAPRPPATQTGRK